MKENKGCAEVITALIVGLGIFFLTAWIVQYLFNFLAPTLFNNIHLDYEQSVVLLGLSHILFKDSPTVKA